MQPFCYALGTIIIKLSMKQIVKSVTIVTLLGILTRILGLVVRIYLSREIGATELGVFQVASSAFFLLCALVTSGLPLVISRKIAKEPHKEPSLISSGLILSVLIAGAVCLIIICFPKLFTAIWGQEQSFNVLVLLLPALVATAIYVPYRGALWGNKSFFWLSVIELIEQLVRFVCLFVLFLFGSKLFSGAEIAGLATMLACLASTLVGIVYYYTHKKQCYNSPSEIKNLLIESAPIATTRISTSVVSMIISVMIPALLTLAGRTHEEALALFGTASGMVIPLLTVPGTVIGSIAIILLPELSQSTSTYHDAKIDQAFIVSSLLSLAFVPLYFGVGAGIGEVLYNNSLAGSLIRVGSFLLLPLGLSQISTSVLNALSKERKCLLFFFISNALLLVTIAVLTKPLGIYALVVGFGVMSLCSTLLNLFALKKLTSAKFYRATLLMVIFCVPSSALAKWMFDLLIIKFKTLYSCVIAGGISMLMFGALCVMFKLVDLSYVFGKVRRSKKAPKTNFSRAE